MTAKIKVPVEYDLASIAKAAGNSNVDERYYADGYLYVGKVEQSALTKALDNYTHVDLSYREARRKAFEEHEGLPDDVWGNIDEIWKALETAELHGMELPKSASSIIRIRRAIKTKLPPEGA